MNWKNLLLLFVMAVSLNSVTLAQVHNTPIFFVHGSGPSKVAGLQAYVKKFAALGIPKEHLHELKYSYKKSFAYTANQIFQQISVRLKHYPPETKFDLIAYSMGTAVSLRAILENDLPVQRYISIAGVEMGQHKKPWICNISRCSDAFDILTPFNNPWIVNQHTLFAEKLSSFSKVAIYSLDDGNLSPFDANVFADSVVYNLENLSHVDLGRSDQVFDLLRHELLDEIKLKHSK